LQWASYHPKCRAAISGLFSFLHFICRGRPL
jgi:hypothetical protein